MKPILPRPLLWTEIKTMDEFLNGERFAHLLYNNFRLLQKLHSLPVVDELVFFNELYFQLTRYYYEKPKLTDFPRYVDDIRKSIGHECYVDLLLTMMYHYCRLRNSSIELLLTDRFLQAIVNYQCKNKFWSHFLGIEASSSVWMKPVLDPQNPCPVAPSDLAKRGMEWDKITNQYDLETIKEILNLWKKNKDREDVAMLIKRDCIAFLFILKPNTNEYRAVIDYLEDVTGEKDVTIEYIQQLEKNIVELKEKLRKAEELDKIRIDEIDRWHSQSEDNLSRVYEWETKYEEEVEKNKKAEYVREEYEKMKQENVNYRAQITLLKRKNKELQQQHEEDEARMLAGFGSLVLETYENGEITNRQLVETDTHKALAESQKQNDLSKKQIKEMEQQIKVLNDKLGNTTVPLKSLSEGLKRYAKLYGLKEGKDLLKSLSYILQKEHVWVDNVENLENFFIKAEDENKPPALSLKNESGGIVQISETKLP